MSHVGPLRRWGQTVLYDAFPACFVCSFTGPLRVELWVFNFCLLLVRWFSSFFLHTIPVCHTLGKTPHSDAVVPSGGWVGTSDLKTPSSSTGHH